MTRIGRREFIASAAAAMGATVAWARGSARPSPSTSGWRERRELFKEGVASGDPAADSVLLWTRVGAPSPAEDVALRVEVAEDEAFARVVARAKTRALAAADHTCRVLVAGLQPARVYWYRFITEKGDGSRIGRTRTAAADDDTAPVRFAFVSCQNINEGAQNAYRRMIHEDEAAPAAEQLAFVLHLGDFVYEVVEYPEDRPVRQRYDRRLRDLVHYPEGEKVMGWHIPVSVADYRALYRAYLQDPDIQDARARFPFVPIWDNHEFSWLGFQSFQRFEGKLRAMQTRKVAANQAWFEYQPARIRKAGGPSLERFEAPAVKDAPIEKFDDHGLGLEPGNLAAIESLSPYRNLRWGRNLDLIITDQYSHRSEEPSMSAPDLTSDDFPELVSEEAMRKLDARLPQTILGPAQRAWFLDKLRTSSATWKVWGCSSGTLDWRADPQNLPQGTGKPWPASAGYACFGGGGDYGTAYNERGVVYDAIKDRGITGFITVSGDRHSFWAGLSAKDLPPRAFEPVGAAFVTGSISAPGLVEAFEHRFPKDHPLRPLYVADRGADKPLPAVNLLLHHGVRSCLEFQKSGDAAAARAVSNPDLSPHLRFVDMGGHGYSTLRVSPEEAICEFVCIPRPLERSEGNDGGPLRYRVTHKVALWRKGVAPALEQRVIEGDPGLAL